MVRNGELKAPIVIGRDHLDSGSVASPNRETEAMRDGSDAVSDWPLLNALLNTASGATWVSLHHGGGVGMGFSQHSGVVICCDGSDDAARRIERVLWNDPATGVMRHADAGYDIAVDCARDRACACPRSWATDPPCRRALDRESPAVLSERAVKLLLAEDYHLVPWKNGGGVTREVAACYPQGGDGQDFLWRVSIATVAGNGPFSHFGDRPHDRGARWWGDGAGRGQWRGYPLRAERALCFSRRTGHSCDG
jgi:hypothetical protein